ncbi:MAG: efflux RND transporter permease subunit, partial [Candidatus Eremiobacteraeota bacterium]|nr:efflux RND transporter permease subunit [Candidatus Eremiobacteraeota bacterium]
MRRFLSISQLAIDFPWATIAFWIALSAAGAAAFFSLKLALFPDIAFPVVLVTANSSQMDPGANERIVTIPLETALRGVPGLSGIHSLTYPQFVVVDMSFDVGADLEERKRQVADTISHVALPPRTSLKISPIDLNETAVVTYALSAPGKSLAELAHVANAAILPRLGAVAGVLKVQIIGGVQSGPNASSYSVNGRPAVALAVVKRGNANSIDVAEACDDVVSDIAGSLAGVQVARAQSQAVFIREASRATQEALGLAV